MPRTRNSNPCDACQLQHIKCEETRPCYGCRSRGIECTTLRVRKKRGPRNGPRSATKAKIEEFQRSIRIQDGNGENSHGDREQSASTTGSMPGSGEDCSSSSASAPTGSHRITEGPDRIPIDDYHRFIRIFRKRAYPVWPVINCDELLSKLETSDCDYESWALGAAILPITTRGR